MSNRIQEFQNFFKDQIKESEDEVKAIMKSPIRQLIQSETVYMGYVDHVDLKRAHVVIRFPKNQVPRLKVPVSIVAVKTSAFNAFGKNIDEWTCPFIDFLNHGDFHSDYSDLLPLYYLKRDDTYYDYIGCTRLNSYLFNLFRKQCEKGNHLRVLVFSPLPPLDYLRNLINFLDNFGSIPEQTVEPKMDYDEWRPEELSYDPNNEGAIAERIMRFLDAENCCVVQGPPGSGKSYTIAQIISTYLNQGKTVCATTMANKGIIELIKQEPLTKIREQGRITKSNLTADEEKLVPGVKLFDNVFSVPKGELLCCSNYVLSFAYSAKDVTKDMLPSFDLVVIEEASQAFLATILAFKQLGKHCLIVGDPMQLSPIVKKETKSIYKSWNITPQVEGLRSFVLGTDVKSFKITTTFRLTPASARLTSAFYRNNFRSVQKERVDFSKCDSQFFPLEGGVLYYYTHDTRNGILTDSAIRIIDGILRQIEYNYPKYSVAVVTPFIKSAQQLQKHILPDTKIKDITVETVDRIQGMTVDYAIFYIPGRFPGFALNERRFNVATSRSMSTTVIVSDMPITKIPFLPPTVSMFLHGMVELNQDDESYIGSQDFINMQKMHNHQDILLLYPGLEDIVESLLENNIPFSHDGDVDLLDQNGMVIATAGMLLANYNLVIDPVDDDSRLIFEKAGYKVISSEEFNIDLLK